MSKNYSILFDHKIPSFIRDDPNYKNFLDFFQAYYDWFHDNYLILDFESRIDIDSYYKNEQSSSEYERVYTQFLEHYKTQFLPGFPNQISADPVKLIKLVKELYKSKGIPDSFKFLFRAVYNSPCEVYPTRNAILKASDGKWLIPKSIKIKSIDSNFLNINNFKVFGEISKTIGIIESSKFNDNYIQIYLSNIDRLFYSGEPIRIKDSENKDVYFLDGEYSPYKTTPNPGSVLLASKIIGSLSSIQISPNKRGAGYLIGDPVVITGGLNPEIQNPIKAQAEISEITEGSIEEVVIIDGGFGYNLDPNTVVQVYHKGQLVTANVDLYVSSIDGSVTDNVSFFPISTIIENQNVSLDSTNYNFTVSANINSTIESTLEYIQTYPTHPITSVTVNDGGYGFTAIPTLKFISRYTDSNNNYQNFYDLGVLGPIDIISGGQNYSTEQSNNIITITGGDGQLAFARISSVGANGNITGVEYYLNPESPYALGGMGYKENNLPIVQVNSDTGNGAILQVSGVFGGQSAKYSLITDRIGQITKIKLTENGEDYISTPNVSLRIQEILVNNVYLTNPNVLLYQGNSQNTATYKSYIDNIFLFDASGNPEDYIYRVRTYDYKGTIDINSPIKVVSLIDNQYLTQYNLVSSYTNETAGYLNGIKTFGDGLAKASAIFLDGLIVDEGRYLNEDGKPSGYNVLEDETYNNYTYFLKTEQDYSKYKDVLKTIVHPIGSQVIAKNLINANNVVWKNKTNSNTIISNTIIGVEYLDYTANLVYTSGSSSNTILVAPNTDIFVTNSFIKIITNNKLNIHSKIISTDQSNNTIQILDYVRYKLSNVFYGYTQSNTVIVTNVNYGNSLQEILSVNDNLEIGTNNNKVINISNSVIYFNEILTTSGNFSNPVLITVHKELQSNNITILNI